ncbi:MAG: YkgJ family cysteine cluster protein [Rubrivivax sp.]|jgi:Fe-S-cluster containining protein
MAGQAAEASVWDCQHCGACCAQFRVSFYWAEADDAPGGTVPVALTQPVGPLHRCMQGTAQRPVRCVALQGTVGERVACSIYAQRASTCRSVQPGDEQCLKARQAHGLPG